MPIEGPMPIINEGENEASHGQHIKVLALECRRTKQKNIAIKELMARTYARRRKGSRTYARRRKEYHRQESVAGHGA